MALDPRAGPLTKSKLQFKYPSGPTANDDPLVRGVPDSVLLNRDEWYEVLYFCNKYSKGSLDTALKSERLIKERLPGEVRGQANVLKWLQENWDIYS
jgi:hypothetical protein